jgi:hypothetical protein
VKEAESQQKGSLSKSVSLEGLDWAGPSEDSPWHWLLQREDVREAVERMACDSGDVYRSMIRLQPLFPTLAFRNKSKYGHGGLKLVGTVIGS